ncbi:MAG: T9SS type A sorting domain-containing protein [Bacteroidetes bacterium]|nr:T9SS type A sorting domain-containing protein [Bacteroidota bacterium]
MKKLYILAVTFVVFSLFSYAQRLSSLPEITPAGKGIVIPYVDNIGYWKEMVRLGYVKPQKAFPWVAPKSGSSYIRAAGLPPQDSPDVPVTTSTVLTQSENSVFINPMDEDNVLISNNSSDWGQGSAYNLFGADSYHSFDNGLSWGGSYNGAGKQNNGDPATGISRDGRWYIGKISNTLGQNVAYSTDQGNTWHDVQVAAGPVNIYGILDKNHLWVDNSPSSAFQGNVYVAWTNFITGSPDTIQIQCSRSNDGGLHWSSPVGVSHEVNALNLNHGVNIATGPAGEVYLAWSIYDAWPSDETAIGFASTFDGGGTWQPSHRIISNIKGIRSSMTSKAMRVNSFPSMAVDLSNSPNHGALYVVWANVGTPGINTGSDIDVYLIKSADNGNTWSSPVKVNQDAPGLGKQHFFPWITVDAVTGGICVIYYDDRNVSSTEAETWVSYSYDGGNSFTDFRISDVSFTPSPVPGLAFNYFGDYIGIQSLNMKVYPVWTDNRLPGGQTMTWTSPFNLGPTPGQPWVMYYTNEFSSITTGSPTGLNFGDSLHLTLGLKNIGDLPSNNMTVKVTSPSPYIMMTDSLESYPGLVAGATETVQSGFAFKVNDTIPYNEKVKFNVNVSNADTSWNSHFTVSSHAPGLGIVNMTIHDASGGNNNGRFDPGETVDVVVMLSNGGDYPCPGTYGKLRTDSPYLTILNDSVFADTISPSQFVNLHYTVTVSDSAPTSTGARLYYTAQSGKYIRHAGFYKIIGAVVEDWETNTFFKFPWHFAGNAFWDITTFNPYEGIYSASSKPITDDQFSQMFVTYTSASDDSISFWFKTSTELDYDFLKFYIDNVIQSQWSGGNPWTRAAFPVSKGTHTYKWIYQKDMAASWGSDRVGLDYIIFPVPVVPDISIGPDDTICAGANYSLHATALQYDSLRWSTYGDGSFSNPTVLEPVYTPGSGDIIQGLVRLNLTAYSTYGRSIKSKNLTIAGLPIAEISVFPKDPVCHWQTIRLTADTTNVHAYLWTPGNLTTSTVIIDTAIAGGIGTKLFRLRTWNIAGCYKTDSVWLTFKNCLGIGEEPGNFSLNIYPNPSSGGVTLEIFSPFKENIGITIEDMQQKQVFEEKNVMVSGRMIKSINFAGLPSGIYIVSIHRKIGTFSGKLVISR